MSQIVINFPDKASAHRFLQRANTAGIIVGDNDDLYFNYAQVIKDTTITFVRNPPEEVIRLDTQERPWFSALVRVRLDGEVVTGVVEADEEGWVRLQDRDQMCVKRGKVELVPAKGGRANLLAWYTNDPSNECAVAADWVVDAVQDAFPAITDEQAVRFLQALRRALEDALRPAWDGFSQNYVTIGTRLDILEPQYTIIDQTLRAAGILEDVYNAMEEFAVHIAPGHIWYERHNTDAITLYGERINKEKQ